MKIKEEKKYLLKKYLRILIPISLVILLVVTYLMRMKWNETPSSVNVDTPSLGLQFKEALSKERMLMIKGETERIAYQWFYDKGKITSIYDTDLKLYETAQWEEQVKHFLLASKVYAYQYSSEIELNGSPELTIKLLHVNSDNIKIYRLGQEILTYIQTPVINQYEDGAEISFVVTQTDDIYCIVVDCSNPVAIITLNEDISKEVDNQYAVESDNVISKEQIIYQDEEPKAADVIFNTSGNKSKDESKPDEYVTPSENLTESTETPSEDGTEELGTVDSLNNAEKTKSEELSDMEIAVLKGSDGQKKKVIPEKEILIEASGQEDTAPLPKSNKEVTEYIIEDTKPQGNSGTLYNKGSSIEKGSTNRTISDGTQRGKDKYETDPVPEGKPMPVEPQEITIDFNKAYSCTISIDCLTILDNIVNLEPAKSSYVPEDGYIMKSKNVIFYEGESVFDVLLRETQKAGIQMEYSMTPIYNSNYIEGIHNLYEFDCGNLSGWMYQVNGWYPNYGCSRYLLNDGDVISWRYTCDLGRDVGCEWLGEE